MIEIKAPRQWLRMELKNAQCSQSGLDLLELFGVSNIEFIAQNAILVFVEIAAI